MSSLLEGLALFRKLITEHGSAEILEKHLSLVIYEAAQLKSKLLLCESEIAVLREEIAIQKTDNAHLVEKNTALEERFKDGQKGARPVSIIRTRPSIRDGLENY